MAGLKGTASGLAARYATALFELARERDALDRVGEELAQVDEMIRTTPELARLVNSPIVPRERLQEAVLALADRLELAPILRSFLGVLAQKRRLFVLPLIRRRYEAMLMEHRGETRAEVETAVPLDDAQLARLGEALERHAGRRVRLEVRVDPGLLGGLVVQIGSRRIDASLRTKLQNLELSLKGVA